MADTQAKIGKLLDADEGRDAIHIAVAPVVADNSFAPGQHASLGPDGRAMDVGDFIGIVDPFLKERVRKGQRFFLFLYPNTITSLRHLWTHPAFPAEDSKPLDDLRAASVRWMRAWATEHMIYDYYGNRDKRSGEEAYESAIAAGHNESVGPYESARDTMDAEWWHHWQNITGSKKEKPEYFSCAC